MADHLHMNMQRNVINVMSCNINGEK